MTMITMHNAHLRRHFADQRARDNEGDYEDESAELRQAAEEAGTILAVCVFIALGIVVFSLWWWMRDKTVFIG